MRSSLDIQATCQWRWGWEGETMTSIILFCSEMGIPRGSDAFKLTYSPTHARAAPYFVGMVVGILLHDERVAKFRIPKVRQITIQNIVRGGGGRNRPVRANTCTFQWRFILNSVGYYLPLCIFPGRRVVGPAGLVAVGFRHPDVGLRLLRPGASLRPPRVRHLLRLAEGSPGAVLRGRNRLHQLRRLQWVYNLNL